MKRRIYRLHRRIKPAPKKSISEKIGFNNVYFAVMAAIITCTFLIIGNLMTVRFDKEKNGLLAENDSLKEDIVRYKAIVINDSVEFQNNLLDYITQISMNSEPNDLETLTVSNASVTPMSAGFGRQAWATRINIRPNDVAAVQLYFHNCSNGVIRNPTLLLHYEYSDDHKIVLLSAAIRSENVLLRIGFAEMVSKKKIQVTLDSTASLYAHGSRDFTGVPTDSLLTQNGIMIKDIQPGWSSQGVLVLNFSIKSFDE